MPSTTLGYERIANWAFQIEDEGEFVAEVLAGQPEPPTYFARMKVVNRDDPPTVPAPSELGAARPHVARARGRRRRRGDRRSNERRFRRRDTSPER